MSTARILVVEDEAVLRLTFRQFLEAEGHALYTAGDYDEAIKHLADVPIDIIVTDILLPGRTGVDLLRTVQDRDLGATVIMITGEPNADTAAEAVRLGAFDYLAKPVTGNELKRVVRLALDRRALARDRDRFAARMEVYRRELEAIFNSVNDGIIMVDDDMRVRHINRAARRILGVEEDEADQGNACSLLGDAMEPACLAMKETLDKRKSTPEIRVEAHLPRTGEKVLTITTRPIDDDALGDSSALLILRDITKLTRLEERLRDRHHYQNMVGKSPPMREVFQLIENVAPAHSTVLICGESGTGKELVAAALHYAGARANGPFVKVNCAALAEEILESELFGHVKGAFTGAVRDRVGRFEAANGGTILLDEIADIPMRTQLRLLRVLQEREFERVGDTAPVTVDVRIIASSNRDLRARIASGEFREDLYYRLNVIRIELPPLRERAEDIPLLVDYLCTKFNEIFRKEIKGLAPETMEYVMNYPWWGNVRELENSLERAFAVCHGPVIMPEHLPPEVINPAEARPHPNMGATPRRTRETHLNRAQLLQVLRETDWNIAKSARLLGVARNTLYQKIKAMDIQRPAN